MADNPEPPQPGAVPPPPSSGQTEKAPTRPIPPLKKVGAGKIIVMLSSVAKPPANTQRLPKMPISSTGRIKPISQLPPIVPTPMPTPAPAPVELAKPASAVPLPPKQVTPASMVPNLAQTPLSTTTYVRLPPKTAVPRLSSLTGLPVQAPVASPTPTIVPTPVTAPTPTVVPASTPPPSANEVPPVKSPTPPLMPKKAGAQHIPPIRFNEMPGSPSEPPSESIFLGPPDPKPPISKPAAISASSTPKPPVAPPVPARDSTMKPSSMVAPALVRPKRDTLMATQGALPRPASVVSALTGKLPQPQMPGELRKEEPRPATIPLPKPASIPSALTGKLPQPQLPGEARKEEPRSATVPLPKPASVPSALTGRVDIAPRMLAQPEESTLEKLPQPHLPVDARKTEPPANVPTSSGFVKVPALVQPDLPASDTTAKAPPPKALVPPSKPVIKVTGDLMRKSTPLVLTSTSKIKMSNTAETAPALRPPVLPRRLMPTPAEAKAEPSAPVATPPEPVVTPAPIIEPAKVPEVVAKPASAPEPAPAIPPVTSVTVVEPVRPATFDKPAPSVITSRLPDPALRPTAPPQAPVENPVPVPPAKLPEPSAKPTPVVEPAKTPEPIAKPAPVIEPAKAPEPIAKPAPVIEPTKAPEPVAKPAPVVEPAKAPEPVKSPAPVAKPPPLPEPAKAPAPLDKIAPVIVPVKSPEPVEVKPPSIPEPPNAPAPVTTPPPAITPVKTPEPAVAKELPVSDKPVAKETPPAVAKSTSTDKPSIPEVPGTAIKSDAPVKPLAVETRIVPPKSPRPDQPLIAEKAGVTPPVKSEPLPAKSETIPPLTKVELTTPATKSDAMIPSAAILAAASATRPATLLVKSTALPKSKSEPPPAETKPADLKTSESKTTGPTEPLPVPVIEKTKALPATRAERAATRRLWSAIFFYFCFAVIAVGLYFAAIYFGRDTRVEGQVIPPPGMLLSKEVWIVTDFRSLAAGLADDLAKERAPLLGDISERQDHVQRAQADVASREEKIRLIQQRINETKGQIDAVVKESRDATQRVWDVDGAQIDGEYASHLGSLQRSIAERAKSLKLNYQPDATYQSPEVWANAYRLALYQVPAGVDGVKEHQWLGDQMKAWRDFQKTLDDRKEQLREKAAALKLEPAPKINDLNSKIDDLQQRMDSTAAEEVPLKTELVQAQADLLSAQDAIASLDDKYFKQLNSLPDIEVSHTRIPLLPNGRFTWVIESDNFRIDEKVRHYWIFSRATRADGRQYWALHDFNIELNHGIEMMIEPTGFLSTKAILRPDLSPEEQEQ